MVQPYVCRRTVRRRAAGKRRDRVSRVGQNIPPLSLSQRRTCVCYGFDGTAPEGAGAGADLRIAISKIVRGLSLASTFAIRSLTTASL